MPEGPSIVILREELMPFKRKKISAASGYALIDFSRLIGQTIQDIKSWGKHLLICFKNFFVRIHLMIFGSYRINSSRPGNPTLHLEVANGEINFYTCQVKLVEENADKVYDWKADIMSDEWDAALAEKKLRQLPGIQACDALLSQEIFAGVGNIIKNEALFFARIHPQSVLSAIPTRQLRRLLKETRAYSLDFYTLKKAGTLAKNWKVYERETCPRCNIPLQKDYLGKTKRLSFFCNNCQTLFKNQNL